MNAYGNHSMRKHQDTQLSLLLSWVSHFLVTLPVKIMRNPHEYMRIISLNTNRSYHKIKLDFLTAPQQVTVPILSGPSVSAVQLSVCPDNHLFAPDSYRGRDLSHVFSGHFSDNLSWRFMPQDRKGSSGSAIGAFFKNFLK